MDYDYVTLDGITWPVQREGGAMEREAVVGPMSTAPMMHTWNRRSESSGTLYTIMLHTDGILTCDCPGWCLQKKNKMTRAMLPRRCKHTDEFHAEATRVLRGQSVPRMPDMTSRTPITNMHEIRRSLNTSESSKRTSKTAQEQTKRLLNLG